METVIFGAPPSPRPRQLSPLDANALHARPSPKSVIDLDADAEEVEEEDRPLLHGTSLNILLTLELTLCSRGPPTRELENPLRPPHPPRQSAPLQ